LAQIQLFQTLEDRGDFLKVEQNAPYLCDRLDAWLGNGYYFWEAFIEIAHWWGERVYGSNYIICSFICELDERCFDLVGNSKHLIEFHKIVMLLTEKGLINEKTTVRRIIEFLVTKNLFNYEGIRASGVNSISPKFRDNEAFIYRMPFKPGYPQYLDYKPAIQICILTKKGLDLRECKIIYPQEYTENFAI